MTTIDIRLIRPSPNPIRKTWDEDKMQELAASIKERGVIVPIKVRPIGDKFQECRMHGLDWLEGDVLLDEAADFCSMCSYLREEHGLSEDWEADGYEDGVPQLFDGEPFLEIVYGHRRVEASRRAGLTEVPAIVEPADDTEALIEALIENIQREDMNPIDEARALKALMDATGWNQYDVARRGIMVQAQVSDRLALLEELPEVQAMIAPASPGPKLKDDLSIGLRHVKEVRNAGLAQDERASVLFKAADENLTRHETRAVAEAYKAAPTPELKDAVLNTSGKLGDADRILQVAQMNIGAAGLVERNENERRQAFEDYDRAVKDFLDAMKLFDRMLKTARDAARYGKFSPEGARFAVGRIDKLIDELETLKETLSNVE